MKTLVLIRHAQAEINEEGVSDFERPLTKSGEQEAVKMAQLLKETGITPQVFVCSTALRALTTANMFTNALHLATPETAIEIYEANAPALLKIVTQLNNTNAVAALVGHNPGISNLLYYLTGKITTMPTCAFAIVELAAENWNEVSGGTGKIMQYSFP